MNVPLVQMVTLVLFVKVIILKLKMEIVYVKTNTTRFMIQLIVFQKAHNQLKLLSQVYSGIMENLGQKDQLK